MRPLLFAAVAGWIAGCAGFGSHGDLLVTDAGTGPIEDGSVRVTYLGCSGYLLESNRAAVLIDPYFSRVDLGRVALNREIGPDAERIGEALDRLPPLDGKLRAILVTHGHFDHLMDVPTIAAALPAPLVASPTSCYLAQAAGLPETRTVPVLPGDREGRAGVSIRILPASHDRVILGEVPYPGRLEARPEQPPRKPEQWLLGRPLAFLIEMEGMRIYVDSGGRPDRPPPEAGPVDLAILGVATEDSRERLPDAIERLRPRFLLPSHQDDFFRDWRDGFRFGTGSDMAEVREIHDRLEAAGRLILLEHFRPWTLRPAPPPEG